MSPGDPDRKVAAETGPGAGADRTADVRPNPSTGTIVEPEVGALAKKNAAPVTVPTLILPPGLAEATQYSDIRELGRGGMGVVYLARNTMMNRPEVLKVVNRALLERPDAAERFLREIRSAAQLRHPNVVTAYSAQQVGDTLVFAMEYVQGVDLAKVLKEKGPLPVPNACYYAYQAALGLQHAHEKGMVHRDIKPSNLILTREGKKQVVKILDFGLAKGTGEKVDASLTGQGATLGTPDYISPEQIRDAAKVDIRCDIYSLGCTLYHLLAGRPPFTGNSLYEVLLSHDTTEASRVNTHRGEVPLELATIVAKMMAKNPADRFQTPAEVAAALKPFFTSTILPTASQQNLPAFEVVNPPAEEPPTVLRVEEAEKTADRKAGSRPVNGMGRGGKKTARLIPGLALGAVVVALVTAWAGGAFKGKPGTPPTGPDPVAVNGNTGTETKPTAEPIGKPDPIKPPDPKPTGLKPGEERLFEIAPGLKMSFCWIPPGSTRLGSPKAEQDYIIQGPQGSLKRLILDAEGESARGEFTSKGYWLGKYTVTQEEWSAVMGNNPSQFDSMKENKAKGMNTKRFPVENVSHADCLEYLNKLNDRDGSKSVFGVSGKFVLPTEDEWEYACRGPKGNVQPFFFGGELNGTQANCNGKTPYGTKTAGESKGRTVAVGLYPEFPHPWNLCDMHGNVWQWTDTVYERSSAGSRERVIRGGAYNSDAWECRSAYRCHITPSDYSRYCIGFRVEYRPD